MQEEKNKSLILEVGSIEEGDLSIACNLDENAYAERWHFEYCILEKTI